MEGLADFLDSPVAVAMAGLFGAIWGSFLNVCIARVPRGMSVVRPGSHCFSCKTPVAAFDNIPVLSWFILRGRCRHCGARFSPRYAAIEALTGTLAAAVFWEFTGAGATGPVPVRLARFALYFSFTAVLIVLAFIDFDTKTLPERITLPSIPIFFLAAFGAADVPWLERLIGAGAGYLFLRGIADFYYYVLKREGMGLGDGVLLAIIGAVLGWKALPFVVFSASLVGTLISVPALLWARRRAQETAGASPEPGTALAATASGPAAPPAPETRAQDRPPLPHGDDGDGGPGDDADDASLRRAQIPFGPCLSFGAIGYMLFSRTIMAAFTRFVLNGG